METLQKDPHRWIYPEINPYKTGTLKVSDLHEVYYEESGNPKGKPVCFVHGGPGGGTEPKHRRYFDPRKYRIILFDQRGCGKSTPYASLVDNTTWHLVDDMEKLRKHLNIEKWQIFGGSWGSALALLYAEAYPDACLGLVLRGIFLGRKQEYEQVWYGMKDTFPEEWDALQKFLSKEERADLINAYYIRLMDPRPEVHLPAARAFVKYDFSCAL